MEGLRVFLFLVVLLFSFNSTYFAYSETGGDVPGAVSEPQPSETPRYTAEEFNALTDEEKRDVYLNSSNLLPEGFSPEEYWNILHPEVIDGGN